MSRSALESRLAAMRPVGKTMEIAKLCVALTAPGVPGAPRVPKYRRLSDGLLRAIETGELRAGDRLPGESELAEVLPFSLGTVQKALTHLAERGAVVRRHGSGTFVAETPAQLSELWHFRFPAPDGGLLPVYTRVTRVARAAAGGPWTAFLGAEDFHVRIDRDIDVNREFEARSRVYLSGARFAGLLDDPAAAADNLNVRALLRTRYGAPTQRVVEEVAAETLLDDVARELGLTAGTVGLVLHIRGYGPGDGALSYQVVYLPPDARRLEIQPQRP